MYFSISWKRRNWGTEKTLLILVMCLRREVIQLCFSAYTAHDGEAHHHHSHHRFAK